MLPRIVALLALSALPVVAADGGVPRTPVVKQQPAEAIPLPPLARQLLHRRMQRHGEEMVRLVVSVTLLKREAAQALATDIANEPRLSRPMPGGEDDLNAALPERFFVLQDELRMRARTLAQSARGTDDAATANALGQMMQTCVACHSAFLTPPAGDAP